MWEAIAYVSSGFTLAAFITATVAWLLKTKSEEKGQLISLADTDSKALLVQDALEFFHVNTENLNKKQQYDLAMEQIRNRANKFKIIAILIGFLAILAAALSAYAINQVTHTSSNITIDDFETLKEQINERVKQDLKVPKSFEDTFSDVTSQADSGLTKLLADGSKYEIAINGGGTYWSFVSNTHEYGHGSDIQLSQSQFSTGFAGANYGHFIRLGKVSIRQVIDTAEPNPPNWLDNNRKEAWRFLWEYNPPQDIKKIRDHQKRARGFTIGNTTLTENVPAILNESYLLRSIQIGNWDILVALEVVHKFKDSSLLIAWKILKVFDMPVATEEE